MNNAQEIIDEILEDCKISNGQVKINSSIYMKLVALDKHLENTIQIEWSLADVLHQANQDDVEITKDQALNVLNDLKSNHDA